MPGMLVMMAGLELPRCQEKEDPLFDHCHYLDLAKYDAASDPDSESNEADRSRSQDELVREGGLYSPPSPEPEVLEELNVISSSSRISSSMTSNRRGAEGTMVTLEGRLLRKKRRRDWWVLALRGHEKTESATSVYLHRTHHALLDPAIHSTLEPKSRACRPPPSVLLCLDGWIRVKGHYQDQLLPPPELDQKQLRDVDPAQDEVEEADAPADMNQSGLPRPSSPAVSPPLMMIVDQMELIQCAPDPQAVNWVLETIQKKYPCQDIALDDSPQIHLPPQVQQPPGFFHHPPMTPSILLMHTVQDCLQVYALTGRARRWAVANIIRQLQQGPACTPKPAHGKRRPPHTKRGQLALLDALEQEGQQQQKSPPLKEVSPSATIEEPRLQNHTATLSEYSPRWHLMKLLPTATWCTKPATGLDDNAIDHDDWQNHHTHHASTRPLNLPCSSTDTPISTTMVSARGTQTRVDYLLLKKHPQVEWMTRRVQQMMKDCDGAPRHLLDVGGGRGDLALALAQAFPQATVTLLDRNASSLQAAQRWAQQQGCEDRMNFLQADFWEFCQSPSSYFSSSSTSLCSSSSSSVIEQEQAVPPIDMVVALHACGDLSDLALAYANRQRCPFLICPCCYTKRYLTQFEPDWCQYCRDDSRTESEEKRIVLGKLAELTERPEISRRSMAVINSMRLSALEEHGYLVSLDEYESSSSSRNLVLVGQLPRGKGSCPS